MTDEMVPRKAAALEALNLGLRPIPIRPNDKRPLVTWRPFQERPPTADEVEEWFARWPTANVAMLTGTSGGLDVLDFDPGHEAWPPDGRDLPVGCVVETPRGGRHFWFPHMDGVRCSAGVLAKGVDVRAGGGYALIPPSCVNGHPYEYAHGSLAEAQKTPAPPWLREALLDGGGPKAKRPAEPDARIPTGKRNSTLASLAGSMRRQGLSETAIRAALVETNRSRCEPPLPEPEVCRIAASITRYEPALAPRPATAATAPLGQADGDVRIADEFGAAYDSHVRYCPDLESWHVWEGRRWAPDATHEAERLLVDLCRQRLAEAARLGDLEAVKAETKFWVAAMRKPRIEAGLWCARSDPHLIVRLDELDRDPWLLNCANGTLDLRTGELRPHDPADLISRLAPVEYDPKTPCGEWLRFLARVLPDLPTRYFLQRAVGYSITGLASEEVLFHISGPTASGKSTFVGAIRAALGDYAVSANFESFVARRNVGGPRSDLVRLAGRRFVSSIETEEGSRLAGGLLKWLTGQDSITARALYKMEVEYLPSFALWLVANFRPRAADDDSALWRRLLLVPFDVTIPEDERNPDVKRRLSDPAIGGPQVLLWAVRGCLDWQRDGLNPPGAVRAATAAWRAENDPLADWLQERTARDPKAATAFKDLNADYRNWAGGLGLRPISAKKLGSRLKDLGFGQRWKGRTRAYAGIRLVTGATDATDYGQFP